MGVIATGLRGLRDDYIDGSEGLQLRVQRYAPRHVDEEFIQS